MTDISGIQREYGGKLAEAALRLGVLKLDTANPFKWASGYRMPIYNDNRLFLSDPKCRFLIRDAFAEIIRAVGIETDEISGTSTAGIPHAVTLADKLGLPVTYVRSASKDHGMKNKIEGLVGGNFGGRKVILIEDLISTGGSSIAALESIREAGGVCDWCLAVFSYGLSKAEESFAALGRKCGVLTVMNYDMVLETALEAGYIDAKQADSLREWREDPFGWGDRRGFPHEVKS